MPLLETIAAISTPPGRGGIGIVRLAGPDSIRVAARLLQFVTGPDVPSMHARVRRARFFDPSNPGAVLDDVLVTVFHAPRSYTGDTLVEIAAHGSPLVLAAIVKAALAEGGRLFVPIRLAEPGEFTQRAFLSGRLDLTQAEAVHDLIAAQTLDQVRVAAQQMGGALARQVAPAKASLLHLIALLEAGMDFASGELDDVDVVAPLQIQASIAETHEPLEALAATFRRGQLLREGAAMALVGRPNAGKSSLFNRLLERERAIVTPIPGTTRDTLEETVAIGGIPIRLIDTAGLRTPAATLGITAESSAASPPTQAIDEVESPGIARTHEVLADADLILLIHDATQPFSPADEELAASIAARPHLIIHNKLDLLSDSTRTDQPNAVHTSALTGDGLDALRAAILQKLNAEGSLSSAALLTNVRQQQAVAGTLTALAAAAEANRNGLPHEVLLLDLHTALRALDSLTGITTADDILARIFSTFCIGK